MSCPFVCLQIGANNKYKQLCLAKLVYLILIILADSRNVVAGFTIQPEVSNTSMAQEMALAQINGSTTAKPLAAAPASDNHNHIAPLRNHDHQQHSDTADGAQPREAPNQPGPSDEDAAISASEILTNDNKPPPPPHHGETWPASLFVSPDSAASPNSTGDSQMDGSNASAGQQPDNDKPFSQINYSRPIYRLLFVILFGLVSISLGALYMVKCCGCRRRKRLNLLQRNLVMDVGLAPALLPATAGSARHRRPAGGQHDLFLAECSCFNQPVSPAHSGRDSLIQSLLRSTNLWTSLNSAGQQRAQAANVPSAAMLFQQLALAAGPAHLGAAQTGCGSCLMSGEGPQHPHPFSAESIHSGGLEMARPPAYSDLFEVGRPLESVRATAEPGAAVQVLELSNQPQSGWDNPSASVSESQTISSDSGSLGDQQQQHHQQKNLLVKLNLNKTKLLSAEDLVLLSKLIDVPIVVQQRHQQQQAAEGCEQESSAIEQLVGETHQADEEAGRAAYLQTNSKTLGRTHPLKTGDMKPVYRLDEEEEE